LPVDFFFFELVGFFFDLFPCELRDDERRV
jgi:hypothetical protein